ncbi:Transcriptional regulatory protein WalR [compost metagenome]
MQVHELVIDTENMDVKKKGESIKLTSKEWQIMKLLAMNPTRVFTKEQIYRSVWQDDYFGDENVINVHISRLREKIEDEPASPKYIKTLWGIGYKLGEF